MACCCLMACWLRRGKIRNRENQQTWSYEWRKKKVCSETRSSRAKHAWCDFNTATPVFMHKNRQSDLCLKLICQRPMIIRLLNALSLWCRHRRNLLRSVWSLRLTFVQMIKGNLSFHCQHLWTVKVMIEGEKLLTRRLKSRARVRATFGFRNSFLLARGKLENVRWVSSFKSYSTIALNFAT